ncbi:MAG: DUF3822 family protein [Bacteroidales bacterium]|jgi:hypothetical protein|nr:DUF3822 family protein [Bacteroidales bacterium]
MPFLELFDETLDINSTENYELSVQISPDGFAFCLLDAIRNKYVLIRSTEPDDNKYFTADNISELITKDDFLTRKYKKVNVVMPSPKFTLVPAPLFDPGKKEEYFTFNLNRDDNEVIAANRVTDPDAYSVFSVAKTLYEIPGHFWPATYPFHHTKPLLNQLSHSSKSIDGHYLHVHVEKEFFNIFVYNRGTLKFSNTFNYRNVSDMLYYVLNVFKTMGISNDETLCFSGSTGKYDDIWSGFSMYLRNMKFIEPSGTFTFSYVFNDLELHRFINLFSVSSCE